MLFPLHDNAKFRAIHATNQATLLKIPAFFECLVYYACGLAGNEIALQALSIVFRGKQQPKVSQAVTKVGFVKTCTTVFI